MRYREFIEHRLAGAISNIESLPSGYHLVGHVALLQIKRELMKYSKEIGEATLQYDNRIRSVAIRTGPTVGVERHPNYMIVAGIQDTIVIHTEGGVKYKLDPLVLTFSGGNIQERIRMASITRPGETVFDMFACVGQFSIPIAMNNARKVYATEINPVAYDFLLENIRLNKVEQKVKPFLGDCKEFQPDENVDRVVMGYLHDTNCFLGYAISALKKSGGIVHMHIAQQEDNKEEIVKHVEDVCSGHDFLPSISITMIKNYAPSVKHYVFDIVLSRKGRV
ncbi:MAG: class I SAM-dependent methyltransferase family protein [Candidatus Thorarchaeota archaeon]|nr:class I SAM-dependent methyltransferase family protein [Candidatus Thorarchaeota archaeon]